MAGKARGKPPNVAKAMNPMDPVAGDGRVARVLGWSLLVALIAVIGAALAIWTGGITIAASQTIVGFLATQALIGAVEGLLYAGVSEMLRKRAVAKALAGSVRENRPAVSVRRLSMADLENQIEELEARLQSERQRVEEVTP